MKFPFLGLLLIALLVSGCSECSESLAIPVRVVDGQGDFVVGASVKASCDDIEGGAVRRSEDVTDFAGEALILVTAPLRRCPANEDALSSYFAACSLFVRAAGFPEYKLTLSGSELDSPPDAGTQSPSEFVVVLSSPNSTMNVDAGAGAGDAGL